MSRRLVAALLVLLFAAPSSATVVTLLPSKDNTLFESTTGDISDGAGPTFFSGITFGESRRRAILRFDVSSIPVNASISDAQLVVHVTRSVSGALASTLPRSLADWG